MNREQTICLWNFWDSIIKSYYPLENMSTHLITKHNFDTGCKYVRIENLSNVQCKNAHIPCTVNVTEIWYPVHHMFCCDVFVTSPVLSNMVHWNRKMRTSTYKSTGSWLQVRVSGHQYRYGNEYRNRVWVRIRVRVLQHYISTSNHV